MPEPAHFSRKTLRVFIMDRKSFNSRLRERPFLLDGAMGTLLHSRGVSMEQSFDGINLNQPAVVAEIHRAYIEAGADIIETNSFGANRYKLAEYGLQQQVAEINQAAVNIARRVINSAFREVWLAGSVGPLGVRLAPLGRVSLSLLFLVLIWLSFSLSQLLSVVVSAVRKPVR